jgi:dihydroorotate dehydrogenase electron transfer subunit
VSRQGVPDGRLGEPDGRTLAPPGRRRLTVTANEPLGAYRVLRAADPDGPVPDPGQFAMLAAAERWGGGQDERPYLPRAFSFARALEGEAHFLLEDVGPGTNRLSELRAGDGLWALGPLGRGFTAPARGQQAILVGGGVGIAPLAILQDSLEREATVLLGFRDRAHAEGAALLRDARLASDDGSVGHHGLVTDLLALELDRLAAGDGSGHAAPTVERARSARADALAARARVYACGPAPMLEAVRAICAEREVPAQLALESGMACGFGACFGCVVPVRGGGYLRVCIDGPVIDAAELERVDQNAGSPA